MAALDLPKLHGDALAATGRIVDRIDPAGLGGPTPCEGWSVRDLLNHVVAGNYWAAELAGGKTIAEVGDRLDGDVVGDDPGGTYSASAAAAKAAFDADGAMESPCAVSYGPVPGSVYCGHRFLDLVVHGWDLAEATGQDTTIDPDLVDACWAVLTPQLEMLQASGMFGEPQPVAEDASPQERLLATLGRS